MDILELMKADHDEVAELFDELESLAEEEEDAGDDGSASALVQKLGRLVLVHAKAEEAVLYERCKEKTKALHDFALEGAQEHELLTREIDKLSNRSPGEDGEFKAVLAVCKELFEHHAREEEEKKTFPKLRRAFGARVREQLGEQMLEEKMRILKTLGGGAEEAAHEAP